VIVLIVVGIDVVRISTPFHPTPFLISLLLLQFFLVLYSAIEPPSVYSQPDPTNAAAEQLLCSSNPILLGILIAVKCVMLVFGVFLAITTRKVSSVFNESKMIALSIYNMALIAALVIPIMALVQINSQAFYFTLQSLAVIEVVMVTICTPPPPNLTGLLHSIKLVCLLLALIFIPKIYGVVTKQEITLTVMTKKTTRDTNGSYAGSVMTRSNFQNTQSTAPTSSGTDTTSKSSK